MSIWFSLPLNLPASDPEKVQVRIRGPGGGKRSQGDGQNRERGVGQGGRGRGEGTTGRVAIPAKALSGLEKGQCRSCRYIEE